jgi:predicted P-loop ATPase
LRWDGAPRLDRAAAEVVNSTFDSPLVARLVRLWFIGCVARIYKPGCKMDTMLVLVSGQGLAKSTLFATLAGPEFFTDVAINFESKDSLMVMRRAWIAEHAEMKTLLAARSEEEIKAGITRTVDEFRPPYGRTTVRVPRHTVFAGTTNNTEFLRDPTGNRRYWPISVSRRIDIEKVREWRDQLWAEAVVAYRAGENWWLAPAEEQDLRDYQENFTRVDCWEDAIARYATAKAAQGLPVTVPGVLSEALDISKAHQDPKAEARVKATLERLGWTLDRPRLEDGTRPRRYVKKMPGAANEPQVISVGPAKATAA